MATSAWPHSSGLRDEHRRRGRQAPGPLVADSERIGGSRARHDLIEFRLLAAYLEAGGPRRAFPLPVLLRAGRK